MTHINIEIKARCLYLKKIRTILQSHHAVYKGTDHQIDTYFKVPVGRLKLREGTIEKNLIYYQRENRCGPKQSDYFLYKSVHPASLKEILTAAFGILVVVDKQREIYFIDNIKFHLDTVKHLGTFVEIEAIRRTKRFTKKKLMAQCKFYLKLFAISQKDLISGSYSDLLLESKKKGVTP